MNKEEKKKYMKIWRQNNQEKIQKSHSRGNPKRIRFNGKQVTVDRNIRTDICSNCGKTVESGEIKRTNLHHIEYHDSDPLVNTIELCVSCHRKEHTKLKSEGGVRVFFWLA